MTIILLANTHASMLFPYTTLFRSEGKPGCARGKAGDHAEMRILLDLERGFSPAPLDCPPERVQRAHAGISSPREHELPRSEEHTSELQSPMYLVCRLLLEKKKIPLTRNIGTLAPVGPFLDTPCRESSTFTILPRSFLSPTP